ncbi:sensor histidine kinase [Jatrophihabitans sp. DSM 45814]
MREDEMVMSHAAFALRWRLLAWSLPMAVVAELGIGLFSVWITWVSVIVVGVGIPLTLISTPAVRWYANRHRSWAANVLGEPIPRPYLPIRPGSGPLLRLWSIMKDPATWRDWFWLLVNASIGFTLSIVSFSLFAGGLFYLIYPFLWAVTPPEVFGNPFGFFHINQVSDAFVLMPLGLIFWVIWWYSAVPLARLNARIMHSLLAPTDAAQLAVRVQQLAFSRAETVDTQAAELRRIERDLHDGAQARLVSLGMSLGLAAELMTDDPVAAQKLLTEARDSTSSALSELRDLVRGIHPPVLADRGLDGAVRALALANPIPTHVTVQIPGRLPAPVESAAYFAIAECLTNAIKHSGASWIGVDVTFQAGVARGSAQLAMLVHDNGHGGAAVEGGSGIRGIERRLAAFDGHLTVTSPIGGPTQVRMTLPCELSSPKISPSSATG